MYLLPHMTEMTRVSALHMCPFTCLSVYTRVPHVSVLRVCPSTRVPIYMWCACMSVYTCDRNGMRVHLHVCPSARVVHAWYSWVRPHTWYTRGARVSFYKHGARMSVCTCVRLHTWHARMSIYTCGAHVSALHSCPFTCVMEMARVSAYTHDGSDMCVR